MEMGSHLISGGNGRIAVHHHYFPKKRKRYNWWCCCCRLQNFKENKRHDRCHCQRFFLSRGSFFLGSIFSHLLRLLYSFLCPPQTLASLLSNFSNKTRIYSCLAFFQNSALHSPFILYSTTKKLKPPKN